MTQLLIFLKGEITMNWDKGYFGHYPKEIDDIRGRAVRKNKNYTV